MIIRAAGTNCDRETQFALEQAGFAAERVHILRLMDQADLLEQFQFLVIPGGFSYGDDIAAGKILANQMLLRLADPLNRFVERDKLVLGICNGFQVLLKSGLLPWAKVSPDWANREATLGWNDSGRFEARWVHMRVETATCVFLSQGDIVSMPVAHGEGKFIPRDDQVLGQIRERGQAVLRYVDAQGSPGAYPVNPNGSVDHIAGICDPSGRVLGLMPHPERFVAVSQHPQWTRRKGLRPDGLELFRRARRQFK